ncbi:helix-turn-helix transcriptional regulator [Streptomyces sp. W16]|uniref:helix-turn-helix domain-containing protein n=1 Tax=Streptomyces sp. W16 TaxID=3076631 RepID=UPI00295B2E39|nr:helix-turn-helix transcriptional regulator [Streptomyces sp. W16]MDV9174981.1 helix-turn-helix transcriptional regulator [Streptomyces sp. W16]
MQDGAEGSSSMKMFGAVSRALREAQGSTREQFGAHVGYSASQVAMVERGERMPSPQFIARAGEFLHAQVAIDAAAEHLERRRYPSWFDDYVEREAEAVSLWSYDTHVIMGLVQTEEYARAVLGARVPMLDDEEIEHRVRSRLARQAILTRVPPVSLAMVIEEWVLRRPVGGRAVLKGQLERLLELGEKRNISIQVMPTDVEAHAGFNGAWTLLETPKREWVGYVEGQAGGLVIEDREEVSAMFQRFGMIRSQALPPGESAKLIEGLVGEL